MVFDQLHCKKNGHTQRLTIRAVLFWQGLNAVDVAGGGGRFILDNHDDTANDNGKTNNGFEQC
ncbi:hypothetical protein MARHY1813 [Marinobacter nauticus ATCC 49840]|nr:hypothetical protein MARHY1813 [Marinobacter nauticus ATCC 49840]